MRIDPWQGKIRRAIQITCGNCRTEDEWAIEPATVKMATRFFRNMGWRKLSDGLWYCRKCVPSTVEHLRISAVTAMALSGNKSAGQTGE